MNRLPWWLSGFVRLFLIFSALSWVGVCAFLLIEAGKNLNSFINPHLNPGFEFELQSSPERWYAIIATKSFLEKSQQERLKLAEDYFREHIEPIAKESFVDLPTFKSKFLETATLSLEELPIEKWIDSTPYRKVSKHAWHGGIRISEIALHTDTLLVALILAFLSAITLTVIIVVFRWACRGFRGST